MHCFSGFLYIFKFNLHILKSVLLWRSNMQNTNVIAYSNIEYIMNWMSMYQSCYECLYIPALPVKAHHRWMHICAGSYVTYSSWKSLCAWNYNVSVRWIFAIFLRFLRFYCKRLTSLIIDKCSILDRWTHIR